MTALAVMVMPYMAVTIEALAPKWRLAIAGT